MKILLINNSYPSPKYPEKSTYIKSIYECIRSTGAEVDKLVLIQTGDKIWDKIKNYFILYYALCTSNLRQYSILYINHLTFMLPLFFRLPLYKGKVIIHWHGEELASNSIILNMFIYLYKHTLKTTYLHISPSKYYKHIINKKLGVPLHNIIVSPSGGVDTEVFSPSSTGHHKQNEFHIGIASELSEHKGVQYFYDLIQHTPQIESITGRHIYFHYIIYGRDSAYWHTQLSKYHNVIPHMPYPKNIMPQYYNELNLLLMLSKRESLGLVVLEAMSCNIPVIGRDTASMPELIQPGISGELVPYKLTLKDLIDRIKLICHNLSNYTPREYVIKNYSRIAVIMSYKKIFSE